MGEKVITAVSRLCRAYAAQWLSGACKELWLHCSHAQVADLQEGVMAGEKLRWSAVSGMSDCQRRHVCAGSHILVGLGNIANEGYHASTPGPGPVI